MQPLNYKQLVKVHIIMKDILTEIKMIHTSHK